MLFLKKAGIRLPIMWKLGTILSQVEIAKDKDLWKLLLTVLFTLMRNLLSYAFS
jgi:hypothetical protein